MTLSLNHIQHGFNNHIVLHDITFTVKTGSIHALLGMNGAGKSTLMHITAGVYKPNSGLIKIDGKEVYFQSPADATNHGIVFLTQEVDRGLVQGLSVHENLNVFLNNKSLLFNKRKSIQKAKELLKSYQLDMDVEKKISECTLYEKQLVSMVRAISNQARYLLLDEPTASFDRNEAEKFYDMITKLKNKGIGIVLISHKMSEIFEYSDELTVLRDGHLVLQKWTKDTNVEDTLHAITGKLGVVEKQERPVYHQKIQYRVKDLQLRNSYEPIDFHVKEGEIVTFFGLLGSGKTSLAETLFGVHSIYYPIINEEKVKISSPIDSIKKKIAFIPEERGKHGIWKERDIRTHLSLTFKGFIRKQKEHEFSKELVKQFDVRPHSLTYRVGSLSGGNQQKIAIAKWFGINPRIMILDEPMKGIDVSAKEKIFQEIEELAREGTSILYFTAEPDEALRIADRVIVLSKRKIIKEVSPMHSSIDELMRLAEKGEYHGTNIH